MKSSNKTFSHKAINFFTNLNSPHNLPYDFGILNPYKNKEVKK
jgi:hypothetical protein